jgi:hypothetical protein
LRCDSIPWCRGRFFTVIVRTITPAIAATIPAKTAVLELKLVKVFKIIV